METNIYQVGFCVSLHPVCVKNATKEKVMLPEGCSVSITFCEPLVELFSLKVPFGTEGCGTTTWKAIAAFHLITIKLHLTQPIQLATNR